jgi:hypothetical protein
MAFDDSSGFSPTAWLPSIASFVQQLPVIGQIYKKAAGVLLITNQT